MMATPKDWSLTGASGTVWKRMHKNRQGDPTADLGTGKLGQVPSSA
jgi:hypothetical protein